MADRYWRSLRQARLSRRKVPSPVGSRSARTESLAPRSVFAPWVLRRRARAALAWWGLVLVIGGNGPRAGPDRLLLLARRLLTDTNRLPKNGYLAFARIAYSSCW